MPGIRETFNQKAREINFELDKRNRIGQAQRQIDAIKKQNAADVTQIGTQIVGLHRQGQLPSADLSPLCQGIIDREEEIAELQAKIAAIQKEVLPAPAPPVVMSPPMPPVMPPPPPAAVPCPTCYTQVMIGVRFCPNCGQPMSVAPTAQVGSPCPGCGAPTTAGAAFCGECGYNLLAPAPPIPAISPFTPPVMPPLPSESPLPVSESIASTPPAVSEPVIISAADSAPLQQIDAYATAPTILASEAELSFCPTCGAVQRRPDVRFCFVCGNSMTLPSSPQEPAQ